MASGIPTLDPRPSASAPFGYFDAGEKTILEPISDEDQFVQSLIDFRDATQYDDDLEEMQHGIISHLPGHCIKLGPAFYDRQAAREYAQNVALGIFDVYAVPFGKWFAFGENTDVAEVGRKFIAQFNTRINVMEKRVNDISYYPDDDPELETKDEETKVEETKDEETKVEETKVEETKDASEEEIAAIHKKVNAALARGDAKNMHIVGQKFMVLAHGQVSPVQHLLRYCAVFDDDDSARKHAKLLYDTDPFEQRFDYIVAKLYEWKKWPIDFMNSVEKTFCKNQNLERLYAASMYQNSSEYKAAVDSIKQFHQERELHEQSNAIKSSSSTE